MPSALTISLAIHCLQTQAQWATDPSVNNLVCAADNEQELPTICTDGTGGAIIVWRDFRNGQFLRTYAQHLDADGVPTWGPDGVLVFTPDKGEALDYYNPNIVSDGNGGAFISVLRANINPGVDGDRVFVQHLDAGGSRLWGPFGVTICNVNAIGDSPEIVPDGNGGAIFVWWDVRHEGGIYYDIFAQRVDLNGNTVWTDQGVPICRVDGAQSEPRAVTDGAGGAIIVWQDERDYTDINIYSQRISVDGNVLWQTNGKKISQYDYHDQWPDMVSDGAGGAIVGWIRYSGEIFAQRLNGNGDFLWAPEEISLETGNDMATRLRAASDGSGGALFTWESGVYSPRVQHVSVDGTGLWPGNGTMVTTTPVIAYVPRIAGDGIGGAYVVWEDFRNGWSDRQIWGQYVDATGNKMWDSEGIPVGNAPGTYKFEPKVAAGIDGAIATWFEDRITFGFDDILAQYISNAGWMGPVGVQHDLTKIEVTVMPNPATDVLTFSVGERILNVEIFNTLGQSLLSVGGAASNRVKVDVANLKPGVYGFRLHTTSGIAAGSVVVAR